MNTRSSDSAVMTPASGIQGSRLASLAVLQANFDSDGRSCLDSFVPFATRGNGDTRVFTCYARGQAGSA